MAPCPSVLGDSVLRCILSRLQITKVEGEGNETRLYSATLTPQVKPRPPCFQIRSLSIPTSQIGSRLQDSPLPWDEPWQKETVMCMPWGLTTISWNYSKSNSWCFFLRQVMEIPHCSQACSVLPRWSAGKLSPERAFPRYPILLLRSPDNTCPGLQKTPLLFAERLLFYQLNQSYSLQI